MKSTKIIALCLIAPFLVAGPVEAARYKCPCVRGPYPKPAKVKGKPYKDKKGGIWTLTCTNESKSGDFVWTYQAAAGAKKKTIGRCIYVGGQNKTGASRDAAGNIKIWWHTCRKPGTNKAILDVFDKTACKSTQRDLRHQNGRWEEVSRRDTSNALYAAFSDVDANGDTIPDENFAYLTAGIYDVTPPLLAEYETRVTLEVDFIGGANNISWDIGEMTPTLNIGDEIVFSDLALSMAAFIDPRFLPLDTIEGLALTAIVPITPATGEILASFVPPGPGPIETRWAIVDQDAEPFWSSIFDSPSPIEDLGFSLLLDLSDMPGYDGSAGDFVVLFDGGPCCLPDNTCSSMAEIDCTDAGGIFLGLSTPGDPLTCADSDCDGDGTFQPLDNCPESANGGQLDSDLDLVGDDCDGCPLDPDKIVEGICGCGLADVGDDDGDEWLNCVDQCPGEDDSVDVNGNGVADCLEPAIPTVSEWGVILMTLLLVVAGMVVLSQRRRPSAAD